jgi:alpha-1,3-rhamnosyl/mannosyltransferase
VLPHNPAICIDCSPLLVRSAGVKTYLYHWLNAMRACKPDAIRTFLAPSRPDLFHEGGIRLHPLRIATLLALNMLPPFFCGMLAPPCDIFHISNLLRNVPRRRRLTATVHDLTAWLLPDCHTPATVAADKSFAERVLRRADGLIAVSENTKRDAIRMLGLAPHKIRVIHLGVPPGYASVTRESIARVTGALALRKPYFLSVGTIEPRKNVDTLLTSWQSLPASFRDEYELIIAGLPGWRSDATTQRLMQATSENRGIRYLGYVPESDLPALTAGAAAFVYPSLYEGFGIPVAQAMAAGCPVITANVSSLPEITGGAAVLIDPQSVAELSAAILRVGESSDLRAHLKARGTERARRFTWEAAASESLRYFAEIA